jgi:hypothetical protein
MPQVAVSEATELDAGDACFLSAEGEVHNGRAGCFRTTFRESLFLGQIIDGGVEMNATFRRYPTSVPSDEIIPNRSNRSKDLSDCP